MTRAAPETNPQNKAVRPPVPDPSAPAAAAPPARGRRLAGLPSGFTSLRDLLSFLSGVGIITHEVWFADRVEVAILTVGVALAGLPVVFGADERKKPPPSP